MVRVRGFLPIVIASTLWGSTGTAAHFLPAAVSPLAIGAATMAIGGSLLFLVSARPALQVLRDRSVRSWLGAGAAGVIVYPLAFYSSLDLAGVAIGTVVSLGSAPIFAALIEFLTDGSTVTRSWGACAALALAGMVLLILDRPGGVDGGEGTGPGVLLGLLAGVSYALYTDASRRVLTAGHGSRATMGALFGLGVLGLAPVLVATGALLLQSSNTIGLISYLAIGPMFVAYLFFGAGLRTVAGSTATLITLVEPVIATMLAVAVVGERPGIAGWIGLVVILTAVTALVASASSSRHRS
jgi:DME family drug/metabolite transporter